ncbi:DUF5667 domain-containing protein [Pimelobacter simplex]|uniref:DUF5667 domain-containing protein n=1 Tax=Nocardioides simplex TaxID=2045 RepID=UPI00214FCF31|nr:DUF5667 domain-containing protein [Pimelobacter simplex]UUW91691.1 DUF5667 domain-containing protein [Pimelobacter simplex]
MVMRGNAGARGAEEFDALISGRAGDHEAYADLLELVASLREVPPVEARPDFVSSLRTQLVAAAEREPARADEALAVRLTPRQRRGARERRVAALVGGFAVVAATGSMAMASQDALPGDVLYPVKRAIENAQTNLQGNGASKAETLIAHAESRLTEVQKLTARGADEDAVSSTLQDFTDQAKQASELALDDYATTGKPDRQARPDRRPAQVRPQQHGHPRDARSRRTDLEPVDPDHRHPDDPPDRRRRLGGLPDLRRRRGHRGPRLRDAPPEQPAQRRHRRHRLGHAGRPDRQADEAGPEARLHPDDQ